MPRNGPSGTYSHDCRSRADQSLTRHTPNTCSGNARSGTGVPSSDGVPTTKPISASMSSRCDGPKVGASSVGALRWPDGRITGVPETCTVPARPWYPIGRCFQFGVSGAESGRNIRPRFSAWCWEL